MAIAVMRDGSGVMLFLAQKAVRRRACLGGCRRCDNPAGRG
jgi:hypothetical protein